ncbi:MAG: hypothetical protein H0W50_11320 [Parachlamydiaceae bacterium]|nr:hypothetical protein [Parachlamydiaceae bacterium]
MSEKNRQANKSAEKTTTSEATWPDFAASLYDKLTGRGADITYEFEDLHVNIPAKLGENSDHFNWKLNGKINIRTHDEVNTTGTNE